MEKFKPHSYQMIALEKIYSTPKVGLFLDMGLGKTVITLTAINELMYNRFEISKVLIIAPLRVAEDTWSREIEKWEHLKNLKLVKILGSVNKRRDALTQEADVYVINRDNVVWLINELSNSLGTSWDFDMVVIDELSSFKSAKTRRFRALRKYIAKSERVIGLTGTPAPNGLIDLWSQIYLLDNGDRLGQTLKGYRERYFVPNKRNKEIVFNYKPKPGAEKAIKDKISDICISMKADDLLEMPDIIYINRSVELSDIEMKKYLQFERDSYMAFIDGEVTAASAAALTNKLLQYSNGAMYSEDGKYVHTSNKKLDVLKEILDVSQGKPILCFYSFKHDLERIKEQIPNAVKLENSEDIEQWNKGNIPLLLAHPASAGHGLNLQAGGNIIVWFGLTWSLELYQQANARLYRQGQKEKVIIHHLITEGTADIDVLNSLQNKEEVQENLLNALKARINKFDKLKL